MCLQGTSGRATRWLALIMVAALAGGCGGRLARQQPAVGEKVAGKKAALPFPKPAPRERELDSDSLFSFLVGELGARRGELPLALNHYLHVARLTGSAYAAERAARIALFLKNEEKLDKAVRLWVELAPNAIPARQFAARVALRHGKREDALRHLRAILAISRALGEDGYLQAAAAFAKTDQARDGIPLLETLSAEAGGAREARYAVALLALAAKDYDTAGRWIEPLVEEAPDDSRAVLLYSQVLVARKQPGQAIAALRRGIGHKPEERALQVALGRLLVDADRLEEARQVFKKLHKAYPDEPEILFTLAMLSLQQKDWGDAERALRQLRAKGFKTDDVTFYLGQVAETQKRYKEAAEWYQAVSAGNYAEEARIRLARVLALSGELDQALETARRLGKDFPERRVQAILLEGELLHEAGRDEQAYALYNRALKRFPENLDLRYSRGLIAAELGHLDVLERDMRAILARKPEHADALNALGYTLADQTDRYEEAYQLISRALKLRPDSAAVMDSMGWVLYRLGRLDEARDYLRKAYGKNPDGEIGAHLAQVLWAIGERDKARALIRAGLEKDPDNRFLKAVSQRLPR